MRTGKNPPLPPFRMDDRFRPFELVPLEYMHQPSQHLRSEYTLPRRQTLHSLILERLPTDRDRSSVVVYRILGEHAEERSIREVVDRVVGVRPDLGSENRGGEEEFVGVAVEEPGGLASVVE